MDYNVITNSQFIHLLSSQINFTPILKEQFLYTLGNQNLIIPNIFTFNAYVVTASIVFGLWYLDDLSTITLWPFIRPYRNMLKELVKKWIRKLK